ncbi:MAG: anthranilate synthase component I [Chloroflexi bacterium]|nr:anthranilate synthase component I [Chloroflexota bacterium]
MLLNSDTLTLTPTLSSDSHLTVTREIASDLDTPVSVYLKLSGGGSPSFLLESVTGGEQVGRYSFIGVEPKVALVLRGRIIERHADGQVTTAALAPDADPLEAIRAELSGYAVEHTPGLPRFIGGMVGYLGYETVQFFEPRLNLPHGELPDGIFLLADTIVAFDHTRGRTLLMTTVPATERAAAETRLTALAERLQTAAPSPAPAPHGMAAANAVQSNITREAFEEKVRRAKEHIAAGDIFQVVLSQRLSRQTTAGPFDIYRSLRRLNPSPYMFFFDFGSLAGEPLHLIGASPEILTRLEGRTAVVRPIAGTRPRGATLQSDAANETELLADPKERAEHVMLVDLGRNDIGRVCNYGSVKVSELMLVERYSHVMHIVSHVSGELGSGRDAYDLIRATFPAGTVSGAPKVRAMEIIAELEGEPRGSYAGLVGYVGFDGSMDTCITIRTLHMRGQTVSVQAGAGIVADSDPAKEYEETMNKARALIKAVEIAEGNL